MASGTLKDTQVYDLLDLTHSDVSDWVPESDEELDLDLLLQHEADPQGSSQPEPENSQQRCVVYLDLDSECTFI